jgi:hypothetical protein
MVRAVFTLNFERQFSPPVIPCAVQRETVHRRHGIFRLQPVLTTRSRIAVA